ncbi:hypothetical protein AMJ52_05835 [candidate division TA06 bacterium DG_78]|uniref:DUF5723 domain-containing protein n=1 Tax=candidate division TA06 bacterium DG_78 TaxID=1703772 RepID=A0A0S7YEK8_UNCT6|nr:MAG: hypothetical protein AMJ52_05835 [candidate division TA06 bacterium DG_78]
MSIFIAFLVTTIGFEYLGVDPIAHRAGMGYGLYGDGYSVHYNPGGLAFALDTYYSTSYLNYIGGTHFGFVGYERNQIGIGVRYFYSGSMKKTDEFGNEYGSFGVHYIDLNVGKGFVYKDIGFGISVKAVYANIDSLYSLGAGIDIGALYILAEPEIQIGLAIKNIGSSIIPFIEERETFPYEITIGGVKHFSNSWVGVDIIKPALSSFGLRIGGTYSITPVFALKASYNTLLSSLSTGSSGLDILAGLTVGFGVTVNKIFIDYCYSPYFDLGGGHRISISLGG